MVLPTQPHPALEGDHGHVPSHNPTLGGDHTVIPSTPQVYFPFSGVSVTCDQLQFGNIKWELPKSSIPVLNCAPLLQPF